MAYEFPLLDISVPADEDLSADQYRFMVLDATSKRVRRPDNTLEIALGVLQDKPAAAGRAASVRTHGITKVRAGEALAIGDQVKLEYVTATDAGKAMKATGILEDVHGLVLEAAPAEDDLATILLYSPAKDSKRKTVTSGLAAFVANTTTRVGVVAVPKAIKITAIRLAAYTIPNDADGTCLVAVMNYDVSATLDVALLSASFNAETLVAKQSTALTLTATTANLSLEAGDFVYVELVNNSVAIDTNWAAPALTIEYEDLA